jgi:ribosomal protein L37AE/L43A
MELQMSKKKKDGDAVEVQVSEDNTSETAVETAPPPKETKATKKADDVDLDKLVCPECGGRHFKVNSGLLKWCLSCGKTATNWAYQNEEYAAMAREYCVRAGSVVPGKKIHSQTPSCNAKRPLASGELVECGSKHWVHDGTKLLYCGECGANYTGKQPDNIEEVLSTQGSPLRNIRAPHSSGKAHFKDPELHVREITKPGVNLEEYRASEES